MRNSFRTALCGLTLLAAFSTPAWSDEPNLLKRVAPTMRCCVDGDSQRCLEVLTRDPSDLAAACSTATGLGFLNQAPNTRPCTSNAAPDNPKFMSVSTPHMRENGWYQDGAPKVMQAPALFPADMVAAGSAACLSTTGAAPGELDPYQKACAAHGGYQSVHLYLSIAHDVSDQMAASASAEDPWWKSKTLKDRVYLMRSEGRNEIQTMAANLLKNCKVVSYLYVSSHGSSGQIAWGAHGASGMESVGSFVKTAITPCLFSPGAQLQFDGCNMGCGTGADAVRQGLNHIFDGRDYQVAGTRFPAADPFEGLQVYLNTDLGYNYIPPGIARFFGVKASAYSRNGLGVVLSRVNHGFVTDIPLDKMPACEKEGLPLSDGAFDSAARGY